MNRSRKLTATALTIIAAGALTFGAATPAQANVLPPTLVCAYQASMPTKPATNFCITPRPVELDFYIVDMTGIDAQKIEKVVLTFTRDGVKYPYTYKGMPLLEGAAFGTSFLPPKSGEPITARANGYNAAGKLIQSNLVKFDLV
jgi:hypothetical protein